MAYTNPAYLYSNLQPDTTDLASWNTLEFMAADDSTTQIQIGLFGNDMTKFVDACKADTVYECYKNLDLYDEYDGWAIGAFWTLDTSVSKGSYSGFCLV